MGRRSNCIAIIVLVVAMLFVSARTSAEITYAGGYQFTPVPEPGGTLLLPGEYNCCFTACGGPVQCLTWSWQLGVTEAANYQTCVNFDRKANRECRTPLYGISRVRFVCRIIRAGAPLVCPPGTFTRTGGRGCTCLGLPGRLIPQSRN